MARKARAKMSVVRMMARVGCAPLRLSGSEDATRRVDLAFIATSNLLPAPLVRLRDCAASCSSHFALARAGARQERPLGGLRRQAPRARARAMFFSTSPSPPLPPSQSDEAARAQTRARLGKNRCKVLLVAWVATTAVAGSGGGGGSGGGSDDTDCRQCARARRVARSCGA